MQKLTALVVLFLMSSCVNKTVIFQKLQGSAFGTNCNITYKDELNRNFTKQIDSLIYLVNRSLSTYQHNSDISKINRGDSTIIVDELFTEVFYKSNRIFKETNGYFDPTVGILVNAWGFGPKDAIKNLDTIKIDSLMQFVGFNKVNLENGIITKQHSQIYFDFNAIAKGFGIDVIGRFLENKNCTNYLIEIGGEIRVRGKNDKNSFWRVAIEDPNTDGSRSYSKTVALKDEAMASSGNYRKYKIDKEGRKFVHTINTKTGYATESDLLSATVIAKLDCADVDGYATAFMAMGLTKAKEFLTLHNELNAHLIYTNESGAIQTYTTENLELTEAK